MPNGCHGPRILADIYHPPETCDNVTGLNDLRHGERRHKVIKMTVEMPEMPEIKTEDPK
jgi:hypothetical protein